MTVSYEFLKRQLMKVELDNQLDALGFTGFLTRLEGRLQDSNCFERLWVASNQEGKEIILLDLGNTHIKVIAFLDEFVNEKKVFDTEMYGYLATYTNETYHREEEERLDLINYALAPERENVHKIFDIK